MTAGQRQLEMAAKSQMLDNARYLGRVASFSDTSRPMQKARHDVLLNLQQQQLWKADQLGSRLHEDYQIKSGRAANHGHIGSRTRSTRYHADVRSNVPRWVAGSKEHERKRASTDTRPRPGSQFDRTDAKKENVKLLSVSIDASDDDMFTVVCTNMAAERIAEVEVLRNARIADLRNSLSKRLRFTYALVLENGVALCNLRGDFLVKDVLDLDSQEDVDNNQGHVEELPDVIPRKLTRKPRNNARKAKVRSNRCANKRALRAALHSATSKAVGAPPTTAKKTPLLAGTSSKASSVAVAQHPRHASTTLLSRPHSSFCQIPGRGAFSNSSSASQYPIGGPRPKQPPPSGTSCSIQPSPKTVSISKSLPIGAPTPKKYRT